MHRTYLKATIDLFSEAKSCVTKGSRFSKSLILAWQSGTRIRSNLVKTNRHMKICWNGENKVILLLMYVTIKYVEVPWEQNCVYLTKIS